MADRAIRVSTKVRPTRYIFDVKAALRSHNEAELHAVGSSILTSVRTAERIMELGYASLENLETELVHTRDEPPRAVGKLIITLKKTHDFDALDEEYRKQKDANR